MLKVNLLRGEMAKNGYTIGKLAKKIGMSSKTLSIKLNHTPGKFTQEEIETIINVLKIENPGTIFFG